MSNWFSLQNPFNSAASDDGDDGGEGGDNRSSAVSDPNISAIFRGVAAFLAPPPTDSASASAAGDEHGGAAAEAAIAGMKHDLAEIGDSFKSSLSILSPNKAVSGISKIASNFFKLGDDAEEEEEEEDEEEELIGITEGIVEFVRTISGRAQLWTDFPISLPNDFEMSSNQREHVENIEQLVPDLGSLKQKVSGHLTGDQFWMIYFILLLPRLDGNDFELLSSPKIIEVREKLLQQLQNKNEQEGEVSKGSEASTSIESSKVAEIENTNKDEPKQQLKDEDDVSFTDLEDDDNDLLDRTTEYRASHGKKALSSGESHEWDHLSEKSIVEGGEQKPRKSTSHEKGSESEGSSEWFAVDVDSDNVATL